MQVVKDEIYREYKKGEIPNIQQGQYLSTCHRDGSISIQYSVIEPNRDTVASTDEMSDFLSCCLKPCS